MGHTRQQCDQRTVISSLLSCDTVKPVPHGRRSIRGSPGWSRRRRTFTIGSWRNGSSAATVTALRS